MTTNEMRYRAKRAVGPAVANLRDIFAARRRECPERRMAIHD
jgi:hypothetical protein